MARPPEPRPSGGANAGPSSESLAETGPGLRNPPELADAAELRRIEQKLRAELQAHRIGDEEAAAADPTGHA